MEIRIPQDLAEPIQIEVGSALLDGDLDFPPKARGMVIFAHGSGSSRHSPRNRYVARELRAAGLGVLLMDLLTLEEEALESPSTGLRFDVDLLAGRLVGATDWLASWPATRALPVGYFGASTGAAAALIAATMRPQQVAAIVSRGGRPDMAEKVLGEVKAPTRLIVGGQDLQVLDYNRRAYERLGVEKDLQVVPGASHLFEEPGALEKVADLARDWFLRFLAAPSGAERGEPR
jgi:putative phosphoribosyl transferase